MSKKKSDTYHHGNLKEELVQTALDMLNTEGLKAITLRELSKRLGTSRSAIYRHFKGKGALMKAVILAGFELLNKAIEPDFNDKKSSLLERFHAMGIAYVTFATTHPNLYRLLFGADMSEEREEVCVEERPDLHKMMHGDTSPELLESDPEDGFRKLVAIIVEGQTQKIFKEGNPVMTATAIWSLLHGLSSLAIDGHLSVCDNVQEIYEVNYKILLEGLAKV